MSESVSYEQLSSLPVIAEHVVSAQHIDMNGHMNVLHYVAFGIEAMGDLHRAGLGMYHDYIEARGMTTFTAEQHISYAAESQLGDELAVATLAVDRGARTVHLASFVLNRTRRELSSVVESMLVHVDFAKRRPVPFPDDIAAQIDQLMASTRTDFALPLSGALRIRR